MTVPAAARVVLVPASCVTSAVTADAAVMAAVPVTVVLPAAVDSRTATPKICPASPHTGACAAAVQLPLYANPLELTSTR